MTSNAIDHSIGRKIKMRRTLLGLTQYDLAKLVSLSFQQVQKYESGQNQMTAKRLVQFANVLGVDVEFFFQDSQPVRGNAEYASLAEGNSEGFIHEGDVLNRELLELFRAFRSISSPEVRRSILEMTRSIAHSQQALAEAEAEIEKIA